MTRYEHAGAAARTTLNGSVSNSATTITITDGTGWPTGVTGPFFVTINRGNAGEERVLVTSRTSNTLNTVTRGQDGTSAISHASGEYIEHTFSAVEADAANAHVEATTNVHGLSGGAAVVGTTQTQTLTGKTLTSPTITGPTITGTVAGSPTITSPTLVTATLTGGTMSSGVLDSFTTLGGITGTTLATLAAALTAWTAWTPTLTNVTSGTVSAAYKLIGKTLIFRLAFTAGTVTNGANALAFTLPPGLTGVAANQPAFATKATGAMGGAWSVTASSSTCTSGDGSNFYGATGASLVGVTVAGTLEVT